jgi:YidC/Oxa1 family membrane protein insertase
LTDSFFILTGGRLLEGPPLARFITEPIAMFFGWIVNFLFNIVYAISANPVNTLGVAIVLMTIIFRFIIMPLGLKSQRSMMKMREIQPELNKIKEKYGGSKDPEIMRKMQQEQSALMAKHGANPLTGCLPMLIQMPLFIGLNEVMRRSSVYISSIRVMYEDLAERLLQIPGLVPMHHEYGETRYGVIEQLAYGQLGELGRIVPEAWQQNIHALGDWLAARGLSDAHTPAQFQEGIDYVGDVIIIGWPEHLARVLNRFTAYDWGYVYNEIIALGYGYYLPEIQSMVNSLADIESFLGISIVEPSGWALPGILIPIITGISMFFSSWLMQQRTYDPNANDQAKMMQKIMLFVMPVFMAFITINLVAAVGVFWTVGQIFQVIQDFVLIKKSGTKIRLPFTKPVPEVVESVPVKKKRK